MTRSEAEHLAAAQEHLRRLRGHLTRGDLSDETVFDAALLRLSAAIESVAAVGKEIRDSVFGDDWPAIWSVRNRISHGYIYVDRAILEETITHDLGDFEDSIRRLIELVRARD